MLRHRTALSGAALAVLALTIAVATVAATQPGADRPAAATLAPPDAPGAAHRLIARLGLNPDQVASLRKARDASRAERIELRKEIMRARNTLRGEMLKDEPDGQAVEKLAATIGALRGRLAASRLHMVLAMRQLLTKEQRDKAFELRLHRGGAGFGPGGPGGHRGPWRGPRHGDAPGRGWRGGDAPRTAPPDDERGI